MKKVRNWIRYFLLIGINLAVMVLFQSYLNFLLVIGLLLLPVFSFYSLWRVGETASVRIAGPQEPMERGAELYLYFLVDNPTIFPLINATLSVRTANSFLGDSGTHRLNIPMRAGGTTEVTYPVVVEYCGRLQVEAEELVLMDLLGFKEITLKLHEQMECLILPAGLERRQEAGQIYDKGVSETMESRQKGYDFSDVSGIREYIPGDKLQNIHWKLSMKKEELMVKERVSVSAMQLNVVVELANDEQMRLEAVMELADGVTRAFVAQNLPFTVHYYSVNRGELVSCYIGNEVERKQWIELMLYDTAYAGFGTVEQMFRQQNPSAQSYLYIGYDTVAGTAEDLIVGDQGTMAVLRS